MNDRPVILLAAHGERGGAADNSRLEGIAKGVGKALPEADVCSVLVNVEGAVERALANSGARPVLCLPLLFSDGFFFERKLRSAFSRPGQTLAPPMALWPSFAPFLLDNLATHEEKDPGSPLVVLVAHGSRQTGRSAACARQLALDMRRSGRRVSVGFLEEPPFAPEIVAEAAAPWSAVGLFLGDGQHGREDFAGILEGARVQPVAAFTVGELRGLAGLVAAEARERLRS